MSPSQFLQFGLELMGYDLARQRRVRAAENLARFRSNYGVGPGAISAAFHQLQETEIAEAKIDKPNSFYFLIAMPSIGFVFITRKSRWPAFFVQTTMARHPGRSVSEGWHIAEPPSQSKAKRTMGHTPRVQSLSTECIQRPHSAGAPCPQRAPILIGATRGKRGRKSEVVIHLRKRRSKKTRPPTPPTLLA